MTELDGGNEKRFRGQFMPVAGHPGPPIEGVAPDSKRVTGEKLRKARRSTESDGINETRTQAEPAEVQLP
jgi:hypothetical protein